jgi:serine/threonine-protein kinase
MGTLDYLAPELIRGEPASVASDVYALGCVVHECLTGAPPFGGKSLFEVGAAHLHEPPPDPAEVRDDLTPSLSWAASKALEKDRAQRPPTATAYASLLHVAAGRR